MGEPGPSIVAGVHPVHSLHASRSQLWTISYTSIILPVQCKYPRTLLGYHEEKTKEEKIENQIFFS